MVSNSNDKGRKAMIVIEKQGLSEQSLIRVQEIEEALVDQKISFREIKNKLDRAELINDADFAILIEEGAEKIEQYLEGGVVPICEKNSGAMDYDPIMEKGNAFIAAGNSKWDYFAAIVRGLETFKFPYDWKHLRHNLKKAARQK